MCVLYCDGPGNGTAYDQGYVDIRVRSGGTDNADPDGGRIPGRRDVCGVDNERIYAADRQVLQACPGRRKSECLVR